MNFEELKSTIETLQERSIKLDVSDTQLRDTTMRLQFGNPLFGALGWG